MTEKTEALRLADALSAAIKQVDADDDVIHVARWFVEDADAELRRLHAEVKAQRGTIAQFHHAVAGAGWHPGRTDDLLTDIIRDKGQELRRLHAEVERLSWDSIHTCHSECQRPLCKLTRERDALLEALQALYDEQQGPPLIRHQAAWEAAMEKARAAIKAVEGEKT